MESLSFLKDNCGEDAVYFVVLNLVSPSEIPMSDTSVRDIAVPVSCGVAVDSDISPSSSFQKRQ